MQSSEKIQKTYNATAEHYAATRIDELVHKPFDRMLLNAFSEVNREHGACADFGCGPGHTTKFLADAGLKNITGIDISPEMIRVALRTFPGLHFEVGDLLKLDYGTNHFSSAIAFYAIVHFDYQQVAEAFKEINRVLKNEAHFLFSFHVGNGFVHFDKVNEIDVDIDLYCFEMSQILAILKDNGFQLVDAIERLPYPDVEYATKRGYVWAKKATSA